MGNNFGEVSSFAIAENYFMKLKTLMKCTYSNLSSMNQIQGNENGKLKPTCALDL